MALDSGVMLSLILIEGAIVLELMIGINRLITTNNMPVQYFACMD